jgi:hypothetical protein
MASYTKFYQTQLAERQSGRIEQLLQLLRLTFDGDIINKTERDVLLKAGLCEKFGCGWNLITSKGVEYLYDLGLIHP